MRRSCMEKSMHKWREKYVKCESLKFCKLCTCLAMWHMTGKEGKIGWIMPVKHLKPKTVAGIFIQQQSLYLLQAWGVFWLLGEWGFSKARGFHASDVCMTSVTVVEKLGITLLTFLQECLGVGVPVPCFPCCCVLWGAEMWLVQAEECSCVQVSGVPHSAEAPPCPIPHPPAPCLPGMNVGLDCPCVLPGSTAPPELSLSPTCTLFMVGPKSEDILTSYIFIFQVMAGNKCVASPIWYPFQSIYHFPHVFHIVFTARILM